MASRNGVKIEFNDAIFDKLMDDMADDIGGRARRIAEACNSQSSRGGYDWELDRSGKRPTGRVWSFEGSDENRRQRLIRNLDAGR